MVPLPSLEEQRRIVESIEELVAKIVEVRKVKKESIDDIEFLWENTLAEAFHNNNEKNLSELPPTLSVASGEDADS